MFYACVKRHTSTSAVILKGFNSCRQKDEPSLAEIHQEMSELLDKLNAQKEKIFRGSRNLPQAHEKVCDENRHARKNYIHGRKPIITLILRNCESDLHEPQGNDYEYNEGTIC